jgi:hypothetical protein
VARRTGLGRPGSRKAPVRMSRQALPVWPNPGPNDSGAQRCRYWRSISEWPARCRISRRSALWSPRPVRPVTPEVAVWSPVAPASRSPAQGRFAGSHHDADPHAWSKSGPNVLPWRAYTPAEHASGGVNGMGEWAGVDLVSRPEFDLSIGERLERCRSAGRPTGWGSRSRVETHPPETATRRGIFPVQCCRRCP